MKILFLQNMADAQGGITSVNKVLTQQFHIDGHTCVVVSLRYGTLGGELIDFANGIIAEVINDTEGWGCPRYSEVFKKLKKGQALKALKAIQVRRAYDKGMSRDLERLKARIEQIQPDIIINSHYELLDGIPEKYLARTINHFHTSYQQVDALFSYKKVFERYQDKIGKFIWLTQATSEKAKADGYLNSDYIYNPVGIYTEEAALLENKKISFIGRFSPEKRLGLQLQLFLDTIKAYHIEGWQMDVYGVGEMTPIEKNLIESNDNICYKGSAIDPRPILLESSILLMTSSFEGLPMVVLEANECGVPVLAYDFGEATEEIVKHGETGFVIAQDQSEAFCEVLYQLMVDVDLRKKLGNEAKSFAQQFHKQVIVQKWYEFTQEIYDNTHEQTRK